MRAKVVRHVKGVASHRGGIVRIDKRVPKESRKPIKLHEEVEYYLMRIVKPKRPYDEAHKIANAFEKQAYFRNDPKGWRRHNSMVGGLVASEK